MQFLILLLLVTSQVSFADVQVDINNNVTGRHYRGSFNTQEKADLWKADNISNDSWGKGKRWEKLVAQTDCLQTRDNETEGEDCQKDAEYVITETDITEQKAFEAIETVAFRKIKCSVRVKAHVGALNLFKGKTSEEIQAIMITYVDVIKLLDAGALDTALALIISLPITEAIDQAYKDSVIAKINSCNVSM